MLYAYIQRYVIRNLEKILELNKALIWQLVVASYSYLHVFVEASDTE
jgi:hypothetical protein